MVHKIFAGASLLLLLTAVWAAWLDYDREWKPYQRRYYDLLLENAKDENVRQAIRRERVEIKHIVLRPLARVDRCVTCHLAYNNPAFVNEPHPLKTHPEILRQHPAERFGCTICHSGQGAALTYEGAAHEELEFWEQPMWKGEYLQSGCGKCHKETSAPGAPLLSAARTLYQEEFACDMCHRIDGEGGTDAPDLSHTGSTPLHAYDFTHVKGERTRQRWLFEHFKNPQAIIPDSEMPNLEMTDDQAQALTILMLSLTNDKIPPEYIVRQFTPTPERAAASVGGGSLLEQKGCLLCHTLRGRGGKLGPDLTHVASRRNADWLFQHFKNPRRLVPGSSMPDLHLSDTEANELTRYVLSLK
jgi:mono/diheme cytochrome c family protein